MEEVSKVRDRITTNYIPHRNTCMQTDCYTKSCSFLILGITKATKIRIRETLIFPMATYGAGNGQLE